MKIQIEIKCFKIKISEPQINDVYFIEQAENKKFYITSEKGYNGYEGEGHKTLEAAIKNVNRLIKNHFYDRCEDNPKGW